VRHLSQSDPCASSAPAPTAGTTTEPLLPEDGMSDSSSGGGSAPAIPEHYVTLNVSQKATPEQIKRSYHKLALRHHPDKNPDSGELFAKISAAYAILSDPRKREVYDKFGDQGVQMVDSMVAHGIPPWLLSPAVQGAAACMLLLFVLLLFVCLPILIVLRVNGSVTAAWAVVLIPLWMANTMLLFLVCLGSRGGDEEHAQCSTRMLRPLCLLLLITAFEVMLAIKLESPSTLSAWAAFSPVLALLTLVSVATLRQACCTLAGRESLKNRETRRPAAMRLLRSLLSLALQLAFVLLLIFRVDGADLSWWLVFAPLWALLALLVWRVVLLLTAIPRNASAEEKTAKRAAGVVSSVLIGIASLTLLLLCISLGTSATISAGAIFAPFFAVVGLLLCCCCCGCCCAAAAGKRDESEYGQHTDEEAGHACRADSSAAADGAAGRGGGASCEDVRVDMEDVVDLGQQLRGMAAGPGAASRRAGSFSEDQLRAMSVRQLKSELERRGIPHEYAIEKSELLSLAIGAQHTE